MFRKLFFVLSFLTGMAHAATHCVAPSGLDTNSGTSSYAPSNPLVCTDAAPWQTLDKLTATTFNPGDAVVFQREGRYTGTAVWTPKGSGSSGSPITYGAYGQGALPLIMGGTNAHALSIAGTSYLSFDSLKLTGGVADCVTLVSTSNLTFTNSIATRCGTTMANWGMQITGADGTTCSNLTFSNFVFSYNNAGGVLDSCPGDTILFQGVDVNHNIIGLKVTNDDASGTAGTYRQTNLHIVSSLATNNTGTGFDVELPGTGFLLTDNYAANNASNGIYVAWAGSNAAWTHEIARNKVVSNGSYGLLVYSKSWNVLVHDNTAMANLVNYSSQGLAGGDSVGMVTNRWNNNWVVPSTASSINFTASAGGQNDTTNGSGNTYLNFCFTPDFTNAYTWGTVNYSTTASLVSIGAGAVSLNCFPNQVLSPIFYVANAGNDANNGLSALAPFKTLAKAASSMNASPAGSYLLLNQGDVFRDSGITLGANFTNSGSATVLTNPPIGSGTSEVARMTIGPYGTGAQPIIDAADPLGSVSWSADLADDATGNTWSASLPSSYALPTKLYMDAMTAESVPLLPMPNATGAYVAGTTYKYLDQNSDGFVWGNPTPIRTTPDAFYYGSMPFSASTSAGQWFGVTNTGIQNVVAGAAAFVPSGQNQGYPITGGPVGGYPGAWWSDGVTIYVHLSDNSNPNSHAFTGTHRDSCVILNNVSYVTVQNITCAHPRVQGILAFQYTTSNGTFNVADSIDIFNTNVYNWGGLARDVSTPVQGTTINTKASAIQIVGNTSGANAHLAYWPKFYGNYVGMNDGYFNVTTGVGMNIANADGGGALQLLLATNNFVRTVAGAGLNWGGMLNSGKMANNELTDNQANIGFANNVGGDLSYNYIHESYGEGIQTGGGVVNPGSPLKQRIHHNLVTKIGKSASGGLYNNIDGNGAVANTGVEEDHNTLVNGWGAGATFEETIGKTGVGMQQANFHDNLVVQPFPYFGLGNPTINASCGVFFTSTDTRTGINFHNNAYVLSATGKSNCHTSGTTPTLTDAQWLAGYDLNSTVTISSTAPTNIFNSYDANDFRQLSTSPGFSMSSSGGPVGALDSSGGIGRTQVLAVTPMSGSAGGSATMVCTSSLYGSCLSPTYFSSNSAVASVSGATVNFVSAGSATITVFDALGWTTTAIATVH